MNHERQFNSGDRVIIRRPFHYEGRNLIKQQSFHSGLILEKHKIVSNLWVIDFDNGERDLIVSQRIYKPN